MFNNTSLHAAQKAKNDEFYTMLTDIEKELYHYQPQLKDKVVYCNCDDYRYSNFVKYFKLNFKKIGLKKLICSGYNEEGGMVQIYQDGVEENIVLQSNGSFDCDDCVKLLQESDIVITNPPFSLFRDYMALLFKYNKKFLIIGNQNAIGYKEIFPYIRDRKLWLGHKLVNNFIQPNGEVKKFGNICWFTNMETNKQVDALTIIQKYDENKYHKYENYDAINVDKVKDIPYDYDGAIGVPITIADKICSDGYIHFDCPMLANRNTKYKVLGIDRYMEDNPHYGKRFTINGKETYARILIKKKLTNERDIKYKIIGLGIANLGLECGVQPYKKEHREYRKNVQKRGVVDGDLYMIENGIVKVPYSRILIKKVKI